jgi:hypothetical protein
MPTFASMEAELRQHKDLLRSLYITQEKTLNAVMNDMETQHQLKVGLAFPLQFDI